MTRDATLKDLAKALNVSVSTVARSLQDSPQISEPTKARVRNAAAELGYVVHSAARAVRLGRSSLIGLIIPDVENEFYGTLAKALAQCCDAGGFQLVLAITEDNAESEARQVRALSEARAAGIVIVPSPAPQRETLALLRRVTAVQLIRRADGLEGPWFGIDDEAALMQATEHLLDLGHQRIAYIGGPAALSTGQARLAGYRAAFAHRGLSAPDSLVRLGMPRSSFSGEAFAELWHSPDRPTAVVTGGARLTTGVIEAIGRLGLHVPADLSLVGYGDATMWGADLTTITLPVREIALACGEFLLRHIRDDVSAEGTVPYRAMHRPTLAVRGSTAALAALADA
jgi:DNA-binding LacI/PurR family transcriptional regulator